MMLIIIIVLSICTISNCFSNDLYQTNIKVETFYINVNLVIRGFVHNNMLNINTCLYVKIGTHKSFMEIPLELSMPEASIIESNNPVFSSPRRWYDPVM